MKKSTIGIVGALVLSVGLAYLTRSPMKAENIKTTFALVDTGRALFPQNVVKVNDKPVEIIKLYRENQLIGIIHDENRLQEMFDAFIVKNMKKSFLIQN